MKRSLQVLAITTFLLTLVFGCKKDSPLVISNPLISVEDSIRNSLNIPASAQHVLILSPAAHMDWDWLNPFPYNVNLSGTHFDPGYFQGGSYQNAPANQLLTRASQNLSNPDYYYSVCEMGFLRAFAEDSTAFFIR